jgi:branched-chain amino acid transport system ATP-binding protein
MGLVVERLTTRYSAIEALTDVDLSVPSGSITAVIGANGAGKSTLLRTLSGMVPATSGKATWTDKGASIDVLALKTSEIVRHGIAHVPEGRSVVPELTVAENLELGSLWRARRDGKDVEVARDEVIELFPRLGERLAQRADTLSGGERQMLAIARSLVARPRLLLLDEPSLGLAPLVVEQIFHTINELRLRTGLTIVLVEQNATSALSVADTGVVLNLGRVVAVGPAKELLADETLRHSYLGY